MKSPSESQRVKNRAESIRLFILDNVGKEPRGIVKKTLEHFNVTRTTVLRHIHKLIEQGKLIQSGTTRDVIYLLPDSKEQLYIYSINVHLDEFSIYKDIFYDYFKNLDEKLESILSYVITEMINNVKDHSHGTKLTIEWAKLAKQQKIRIHDNGIGIFDKLAKFCKVEDIRETILHLTKGKLTTDRINHSGEGIFFSSRAVDEFSITANGLKYTKNNIENDWCIETQTQKKKGTIVEIVISNNPTRDIVDIFKSFQKGDSLCFNVTEIKIELSKLGKENYISRSQAKRILQGLEGFDVVILDFDKVKIVGQGFVDETFRVFKNKNPNKEIEYINTNEDVLFMIKRSLS